MCLERVYFSSEIANNALVDVINVLSKLGGFYVQPANLLHAKQHLMMQEMVFTVHFLRSWRCSEEDHKCAKNTSCKFRKSF